MPPKYPPPPKKTASVKFSMPEVDFQLTIPMLERQRTLHALDIAMCSATSRNKSDAMSEQHSNYNGHGWLPEHFWIKSKPQSHTVQCAEKITFLSLLRMLMISGKSYTRLRCVLKFRMEKTFSMHKVQVRKCCGKAAKDREKLVKILAWKLSEGIVNDHTQELARYNLL
jgi:hypothetical protein